VSEISVFRQQLASIIVHQEQAIDRLGDVRAERSVEQPAMAISMKSE
jgi:hypothetical protein